MRKTNLVQLYLYNRAPENSRFESDKFPLLFWKIPKIPVLELVAKVGDTFLDCRGFIGY